MSLRQRLLGRFFFFCEAFFRTICKSWCSVALVWHCKNNHTLFICPRFFKMRYWTSSELLYIKMKNNSNLEHKLFNPQLFCRSFNPQLFCFRRNRNWVRRKWKRRKKRRCNLLWPYPSARRKLTRFAAVWNLKARFLYQTCSVLNFRWKIIEGFTFKRVENTDTANLLEKELLYKFFMDGAS